MRVSLKPKLQKYIEKRVKSGEYSSPDALLDEAVEVLRQRDAERDAIRAAIDESRAQLRRGEGIPASEVTVERIRELAVRRFGPLRRRKAS
jgi:putative addiction module CopG family antidote